MASKADRIKELEAQYKEALEEINASEDEEIEEDDEPAEEGIILLRGNAAKEFIEHLKTLGFSDDEAEEAAEEIEEEVDSESEPPKRARKPAGKNSSKDKSETEGNDRDAPPPPRSRYFGRK